MENIIAKKEWTVAIRYNHWIMAFSIFVLILTGWYIADPFTVARGETIDKYLMGDIRWIHVLFGVILVFAFIQRIYLAFFSKFHADWKDFLAWTNFKNLIQQLKFYALITKKPPEHTHLYGPLQSIAYGGLLIMVFLIVLTGLILYGAGYHAGWTKAVYFILKPVEGMFGGLSNVRWWHHLLTWCFVLFIIVHVYMAFWYDVIFKQGTISSMISGVTFKKKGEH
jgi:Ni/Fe-hydrogenase 1 B-type cytochrome subunit